jgi:nitroimidazol reductase NimA-like FMN-containing flavoprotein (pyridoxamine 5'-phosphate oxidase superfamily)
MQLIDLNSGLEIIERAECLRLLASEEVGRLGVVFGGRPEIFPVNYVVDGDDVMFRTDPGTKLAAATQNPVVFEVDHLDRVARSAWSVILHGRAHQVSSFDSPALTRRLAHLSLYPWTGTAKAHLMQIVPTTMTGRRVPGRTNRPAAPQVE